MSHDGEYGRILAPLGAEDDEALEDEAGDEVVDGEVEIGDEGEEFEQDVEEAREARGRRAPRGPTQIEKESHELTHLPYIYIYIERGAATACEDVEERHRTER